MRTGKAEAGIAATYPLITQVWAEMLGISPIRPTDRFSDLGGTSLLAEAMIARLSAGLGCALSVRIFADDPTAHQVAQRLAEADHRDLRAGSTSVTIRDASPAAPASPASANAGHDVAQRAPRLFCVAGAGATAYCFVPLSSVLPAELAVHGFQPAGLMARQLPDWTVASAARRHVAALRKIQPHGPYHLAGHSFGGHIAAHMAEQLWAAGEQIAQLTLLDTVAVPTTGSVADMMASAPTAAAGRAERLRTHLRVYTVGLRRFEFGAHQSLMWEQGIRVQNRYRTPALRPFATVLVSDELSAQEAHWRERAGNPAQVIRVPGSHVGMLNDPAALEPVSSHIASHFASSAGRSQ